MLDTLQQTIAPIFAAHPGVKLAWLFGSRARGTARKDSDFDFAVVGDFDLLALRADLDKVLHREVDVVDLNRESLPLMKAVIEDGQLVYEGKPGALGDWTFRVHSILDLDWPNYTRMRDSYLQGLAERR